MDFTFGFWHVLAAIVAVLWLLRMKRISPNERYAIFRLGRFHRIVGNKQREISCWPAPGIDTGVRVDLNVIVPGWKSLSETEIRRYVEYHLLHKDQGS